MCRRDFEQARVVTNQPTTVLLGIYQTSNVLHDGVIVLRCTGFSCVAHHVVANPHVGALYAAN